MESFLLIFFPVIALLAEMFCHIGIVADFHCRKSYIVPPRILRIDFPEKWKDMIFPFLCWEIGIKAEDLKICNQGL